MSNGTDAGAKRAVIYTRVSTEDQAKEGFSLGSQRDRLWSYCKARDWHVVDEYMDDGHSGRDTKRPAYQKMLSERFYWDIMVVTKMDRIHRNSRNFAEMMDQLKSWDKQFVSMQESFDTSTAMGRFVMDIIQRIAQLESEQIGERVRSGLLQKAKEGKGYMGFNTPFGYNYNDGQLEINHNESIIVRQLFKSYSSSGTMGDICRDLNESGIPTKKNRKWAKSTVLAVLRNPMYCGYYRWKEFLFENRHEAIIEVTQYNQVQRKRVTAIKNKAGRKKVPELIDVDNCKMVPCI